MRLLGLDPGLRHTGWGVIEAAGNRLTYVADGVVHSRDGYPLAERLTDLFRALNLVLDRYEPVAAAVEETFVNKNPASTLKLGVARGVVLLAPAERGIPVHEYSANLVKKSVVGVGHADKDQVQMMVRRLLPGCTFTSADGADALAVAICHAHHAATQRAWSAGAAPSPDPKTLSPLGRGQGEGGGSISSLAPSPRPSPRGGEGEKSLAAQGKPTSGETARARRLRRDQTDAKSLLWRALRNRQIDELKFRRQEPLLGYTADFICHEQRLIVELDGGQHALRTGSDAQRTRQLEQAGFRVLRFWNNDVLDNIEGVLETIRASLPARIAP
jgi:crossover junction endodeoxyribonuclease RuvC